MDLHNPDQPMLSPVKATQDGSARMPTAQWRAFQAATAANAECEAFGIRYQGLKRQFDEQQQRLTELGDRVRNASNAYDDAVAKRERCCQVYLDLSTATVSHLRGRIQSMPSPSTISSARDLQTGQQPQLHASDEAIVQEPEALPIRTGRMQTQVLNQAPLLL
ncbi:uncharacterized protein L969DRAFT_47672 [Mixia osmundae IAM 14324]|uniref:Uncharacterized protein n=1 Tax=Mixia osmundae (strain CBS 9802 / IAM 14324 / JCM 22182 / KY 12970) TaxID=764103 RepID=G7E9Q1_MIXOS|nr:uncharacterized protein L969DRAFT_47672 [Mixia osmundae IAM 14324]KEI40001.1 hypothetical protein L969DRAFT_47672 [Mixia osmundae IAM 14324]GAA99370.1 hypothetical protein E5Q_06066 [Mixia osmundae IAM 14324]